MTSDEERMVSTGERRRGDVLGGDCFKSEKDSYHSVLRDYNYLSVDLMALQAL